MKSQQLAPFWKTLSLEQMSDEQWESLCDGCARCCLIKLQDEETDEICYTRAVCKHLDMEQCRCSDYHNRHTMVPDCVELTLDRVSEFHWLPETCSYRLISEGKELPEWHHLVSGSRETIHEAGVSVRNYAISEEFISDEEIEESIIYWVNK